MIPARSRTQPISGSAGGLRVALVVAALLAGSACFSEHTTLPTEGARVSFTGDVEPVLAGSCAFSGCHGTGNANPASKPLVLASGQAYDQLVGVASAQLPGMPRVAPGIPDESYLVRKLDGTHAAAGGSGGRMPAGQPPLAPAVIEVIRRWIGEGAARN